MNIPASGDYDRLFEHAVAVVLAHEGGLVDDPADPGGVTNFGISFRFVDALDEDIDSDGDVDAADVRDMTRDQAKALYRREFWDRYGYGKFHLTVATKVFDLAVNMGPRQAHKCLQRACRAAKATETPLDDDGVLGPKTRQAIMQAGDMRLLIALRSEAAGFYRALAIRDPVRERFLAGWLNRAYD